MSRAANGIYTLPNTVNPVVPGTTIEANWANTTLDDVATGVTDSLDRNGRGSMNAALKLANGTVAAPGLTFAAETALGFYRISAGVMGVTVAGVEVGRFTATGLSLTNTGSIGIPTGTTAQRDVAPTNGRFRYNADLNSFEGYTPAGWGSVGKGAAGSGGDAVGYENDQLITLPFVVGQSAMVSGATISIATPAVITIANSFVAGQPIRFTTTGALPTGLVVNDQYFVSSAGLTGAAFQVAATQSAAIAGTGSIATSGTQSGVHSVGKCKDIIVTGGARIATGASFTVPSGSKAVFP